MVTSYVPIVALFAIIATSVWLGTLAQRAMKKGTFLKGYFLGNRGLGAWALALTATVQSGGTFMGFPSLVYSHGWVVALWIASYMMVPIASFAILAKRFAQLSRRTGAITVPDLFRERFGSPALGLAASLFILFLLAFYMIPQFKAGAIIMQIAWPHSASMGLTGEQQYWAGLAIFTLSVVGYTVIGGFLAAVWTDLFQSVLMLVGVAILLVLVLRDPQIGGPEQATVAVMNMEKIGPAYAFAPGFTTDGREFLPLGLAFSFFFFWVWAGAGQPANMVRLMASKDTGTVRRSIAMLSVYNALIYIPLIVICICGRSIIPALEKTDEIVPRLAMKMTEGKPGGSWLAGLILAAPFGAVMATVSSYLVVIASGLVRDIYQRFIRPDATAQQMKRLTYVVVVLVGAWAVGWNIKPVAYLQAVIVFSGASAAAAFLVPALMTAYWRRATAAGCVAAMAAGAGTILALYVVGWFGPDPMIGQKTSFRPYFLLQLDPLIWGLVASALAGIGVSLRTRPPDPARVSMLFDAREPVP
jgi:SSS family solute:Na+ symporter/sodium/pantothenate symporter